jgi:hypothetical protein
MWIGSSSLVCLISHPAEMEAFLSHLALEGKVAVSTQNQAKVAVLFLYLNGLLIFNGGRKNGTIYSDG